MRNARLILLMMTAVLLGPLLPAGLPQADSVRPHPLAAASAAAQDFRPLPFHDLAGRVQDRYQGRLIGAGAVRPTPHERRLGAALVYEFRLLTPRRNLLKIRMDARTGRFLEVSGRGQIEALRRGLPEDAAEQASATADDDDTDETKDDED